jgi:hypothetical protein
MPEAALQKAVTDLASLLGIWWYHAYTPKRDRAGWPDLALIGDKGALFRELKKEDEGPTAAQSNVGLMMQRAGMNWSVWKPSDLHSGRVLRELEGIR